MKVALVLCPQWDHDWVSYPLALLSAQLAGRGHETEIFDFNQELFLLSRSVSRATGENQKEFERESSVFSAWTDREFVDERFAPRYDEFLDSCADRVASSGATVAGFSIYFSNALVSLRLAERIKSRDAGIQVVFGGPSCFESKNCLDFLKAGCVDAVVAREADISFPFLIDQLDRGGRLPRTDGILLREDPASWTWKTFTTQEDLDELPFPDFGGFRVSRYGMGKTVQMSRGCVRRCAFCNWWVNMKYRQAAGRRAFEEIRHQLEKDPGCRNFFFTDSLINGVMSGMVSFCDLAARENLGIGWWAYAIVRPQMTPEVLEKARRAGCRSLSYGVESGSLRVLKSMNKPVSPVLNARVLRDSARAGIVTSVNLIVGYPTETEADFDETVRFVEENASSCGVIHFNICGAGEIAGHWDRYGVVPTDHQIFWKTRDGTNTFPARLARLRRAYEAAVGAGVRATIDGFSPSPAQLDDYCAQFMRKYSRSQAGEAR